MGCELDTLGVNLGRMKSLFAGVLQDYSLQQHVSTSGKLPTSFAQRARWQDGFRAGCVVRGAGWIHTCY